VFEPFVYRVKVVRWVDGDTVVVDFDLGFGVWLKDQSLRLYGVNTPERHPSKAKYTKDGVFNKAGFDDEVGHANAALAFVMAQIPVGADAIVKTRKDADEKYGRWLAEITAAKGADKTVNALLVEKGFAAAYFGGARP